MFAGVTNKHVLGDFRLLHIFRNKLGLLNKEKNDELLINSLLWVSAIVFQ